MAGLSDRQPPGDAILRPLTIVALGLVLLSPRAWGDVIRVPGEFARLDEALAQAAPFDTILVAPGDYQVNLVWPATQGLKLLSEAGPAATCLDGGGVASVIGIYTGVDTTTVVAGFTIRRGRAEGY